MTPWEINAHELVTCNCDYGCPCQFNALPTHGNCEAVAGFQINHGHFGDVTLDGLKAAAVMWWPKAIHEGGGKALMIVDETANQIQRQALLTILSGEETEPGATVWNVFASTMDQVYDPEFSAIDLKIDIESRRGKISVPGFIDSVSEPIRNPVTGEEHRARIELPNGFEYKVAEMGSSTSKATGPIELMFSDRYAQFAHIHLNNHGMVQ